MESSNSRTAGDGDSSRQEHEFSCVHKQTCRSLFVCFQPISRGLKWLFLTVLTKLYSCFFGESIYQTLPILMLKVPLWAEGFYCVFSKTGDVMFGEVGALG